MVSRALVVGVLVLVVVPAQADGGCRTVACDERVAERERAEKRASCKSRECKRRVARKQTRKRWREAVQAYGPERLRARRECESSNNYRLNTRNGLYGAYQFDLPSWRGAGGRGFPHDAEALEQDYRAVRWEPIHGGDPWPNCP